MLTYFAYCCIIPIKMYKTVAPKEAKFIDYRKLEPFQGELKDLSETNLNKLLKSIQDEGFFVPVFVWQDGDHNYLLDGHGRLRVLTKEKIKFDNTGYEIPVYYIPGKSYKQAKKRLLEITSQYQTITYEGFQSFIDEAQIPEAEIVEAVHYDALYLLGQSIKADQLNKQDEWVGLPDYGDEDSRFKLIVNFDTPQDREQFINEKNIAVQTRGKKTYSTWFPYKEKDSLKDLKIE